MGFEQLAKLKKQMTKEAKGKMQQTAIPAAKSARPPHPARSKATGGRMGVKGETVDPVLRVIGKMQKRFPAAFPKNPAPKVPLKIGILSDLLAHAGELALDEAEIRNALGTWCRGSRYWSCLTDGAFRVDLTGAAAGQVTARDAAFARSQAKGTSGSRQQGRRSTPAPGNTGTTQPSSTVGETTA